MKKIRVTTLILGVVFLLSGSAMAKDRPVRFLAIGVLPYNADQATLLNQLVKQSRKERFEFLMHVGDIQGGGIPCTDTLATIIRDLFRKYPRPVVYTPGDNECTDCAVDGGEPLERVHHRAVGRVVVSGRRRRGSGCGWRTSSVYDVRLSTRYAGGLKNNNNITVT